MDRIEIAKVAHQINKAYCEALGDTSQVNWEDAPEWQKESALAGVDMHLANPDATPAESHAAWLENKLAEGWQYGEVKDAEAKTHPCILPYDELPIEQRVKDFLFRAAVHAVSAIKLPEAPVAPVRVTTVSKPAVAGVAVKYKMGREGHEDHIHGTGRWAVGEVKSVPADIASKLLRHEDVYERVEIDAPAAEVQSKEPSDNDKIHETYDMVNAMRSKQQVSDFIKTQFQRDVAPDSMKLDDMKKLAIQLVDQYGTL